MILLPAVLSFVQALGADRPSPESTRSTNVVVTRKGIDISGGILRLPLSASELEGLLGEPDRSEQLTNRILIWDRLGIFAYEDPRSGSVHGIAFRYACEELSHCPVQAFEGMIRAGRTELPRVLDAAYLKINGFEDQQVFWSKKIGKYDIFVELEDGRLTGVEVDIDWDSPPPVTAGHKSGDQEKRPPPPGVTIVVPTNAADFATFVRSLYDFHPHTLTQPEISVKSEELDAFWARVKSEPLVYLPLLRTLLSDPHAPSFFHYDGSKLLLSLSSDRADQTLALAAIPRCDLRDVQHLDYLLTVVRLAGLGLDTSEAGLAILKEPEFEVFVVEHSLRLGQDLSLVLMLLPLQEPLYLEKVLQRLSVDRNRTALKSLLQVLWYTVTDSGDQAIARFAADEQVDEDVRSLAKKLLSRTEELKAQRRVPPGVKEVVKDFLPKKAEFDRLKEIRRARLNRVTDEALYELDALTILLRMERQAL